MRTFTIKRMRFVPEKKNYLISMFDLSVATIRAEQITKTTTNELGQLVVEIDPRK